MEIELIRTLITSYFHIVRKTIADLVPKTIMCVDVYCCAAHIHSCRHLIVNHTKENIQNRLVGSLYKETIFAELLVEDERMVREREKWKELLDMYSRGALVLQDLV
jgi:dynamin 1-like protein